MNKSNTISKLAAALAKAQAEMPVIKFDSKNPFLKNQYASLGAVVGTSVPVISRHGLSIAQFPVSQEGRIGVASILMHESGEWIEDTITVVPEASKGLSINQAAGVSLTYLRRYAWAAILGLVADEDTDGDPQHAATVENAETDKNVSNILQSRTFSMEQMEAAVKQILETTNEITDYEDVATILNFSVLPESAPVKTVQSWFKHYLKSDGSTPALKADDANSALIAAKTGGKK